MKTDRATKYARDVIKGAILAGPHVRDACSRHIKDFDLCEEKNLFWDVESAEHAISFFEDILKLNGGQFEGLPFILLPWQCFIVGSLFGWKRLDNSRRFRVAYIETAKGSGKSPVAAGIGLKGLVADNEPRAEIYAAATHKDQARILFRDALAMFDNSPPLQSRLIASGTLDNRWNLAYPENGSFFRIISSENKGKSGPRPHFCLLDEIHEHPNRDVIEMLRAGFKFRRQPMSVMITNSGYDKTSVCWEYHEIGVKICSGLFENDEFFAYICALDDEDLKEDKYLKNEDCWLKVNPSLPLIPGYDYIRSQVVEAEGMPGKASSVKRLNFCVWTEAENPWISSDVWFGCKDDTFDEELLINRRCWGGLDLSSTQDLSSLGLMFEPVANDQVWRLLSFFWIPGDGLHLKARKDRVPYDVWREQGFLFALPGKAVNKADILNKIATISEKYKLMGIAYDRAMINDLFIFAEKAGTELNVGEWDKKRRKWKFGGHDGIRMMPFGQTSISMNPAVNRMETMLVNKELRHFGNPVLTWCAANAVVVQDENGYKRISKRKSTGRVDGIVAAIMACGVLDSNKKISVLETRGLRSLPG